MLRLGFVHRLEQTLGKIGHVQLVAMATALMGIVNVLSGVTPSLPARVRFLADYSPLEMRYGGHLTTIVFGFVLLLLARGLWRRKHTAWLLAQLILLLSIAVHILKGLDYEEATLALLLFAYLWAQRTHFHARSDPPSIWQGIRTLVAALLFTLAYGSLGFYLLDHHRVERAIHYIYEHLNHVYNFKGLHQFKGKFHPDWSPRYLVFLDYASLPAVVYALEGITAGTIL